MDLKTKEIQLKRYRINNAPAMPHLSVSDRAKRLWYESILQKSLQII